MALRTLSTPRDLVSRILETPDLPRVVQSLDPGVLQAIVDRCGLEDAGPIVALATTDQLLRVLDADLWQAKAAGGDETLDAERFALWLEVLAEAGADVAARKLLEMDFDFVTAALSRLVVVLDAGEMLIRRLAAEANDEDREVAEALLERTEAALEEGLGLEVGGFLVAARRPEGWDALAAVLVHLHDAHHAAFGELLSRCRAFWAEFIDDNGGLYDVLTSDQQVLDDAASAREGRRDEAGYVSPPLAAAFLKLARETARDASAPPRPDHVTVRYFDGLDERHRDRSAATTAAEERGGSAASTASPVERQVHALLTTLQEEGVLPPSRPALLAPATGAADRLAGIRAFLDRDRPRSATSRLHEELGYLANVLVAACAFQGRRFRPVEAADAALATCNLGLEAWPTRWPEPRDLVSVFRVGWSLLYAEVGLATARRLVDLLSGFRCADPDLQSRLAALARRMATQAKAGTPWRARDDLDVLVRLDPQSWMTVVGLVDECPVVPKARDANESRPPLRVTAEFEFVAESGQIAWARAFVESLPRRLAG